MNYQYGGRIPNYLDKAKLVLDTNENKLKNLILKLNYKIIKSS